MKKIALAAAAAAALLSSSAFAVTNVPITFTVKASLTTACRNVTAPGSQFVDFGLYTPFVGPAVASPTATIVFECTASFAGPVSATLDTAPTGKIVGVPYSLGLGSDVTGSGSAGSTSHSFTITGSMTSGQAGDASASSNEIRTLTFTY